MKIFLIGGWLLVMLTTLIEVSEGRRRRHTLFERYGAREACPAANQQLCDTSPFNMNEVKTNKLVSRDFSHEPFLSNTLCVGHCEDQLRDVLADKGYHGWHNFDHQVNGIRWSLDWK